MKILHIIDSMNPKLGGVCKAVRTIVKELSTEGIVNEVASLDIAEEAFLAEDNFPIYALGPAKTPWRYSENLMPWLEKNLQNYDYVIIHGLWLYTSYASYTAFKKLKEKRGGNFNSKLPELYIMPHGMLDPYFQSSDGRRLKAVRNFIYWKLIESKMINGADGLLFTCEEERKLAHKPFHPYQPEKEIVVGLGIEAPPEYELEMSHAFNQQCDLKGRSYFLFLSRIHEKKGVEKLLTAYETLRKTSGADSPVLVIAGPGNDSAYGKRLQERVKQSPALKNAVFFPGMLTDNIKWGAFYGCEAFILPSEQENFGIAIVEALACGKPVLISDQVNIWSEIEGAAAGLVAPATLSGTLYLLESWMKLSAEEKMEMGTNAAQCYKRFYAVESFVQQWKIQLLKKEPLVSVSLAE